MTINQLFRKSPTKELIIEMLNIIGLNDLDDRRKFTKKDLDNTEIIEEFSKLKNKFEEYYLPCKLKIYFTDINCKRIITILRQCLKLFNYSIKSFYLILSVVLGLLFYLFFSYWIKAFKMSDIKLKY